jgi:hypothetical protein
MDSVMSHDDRPTDAASFNAGLQFAGRVGLFTAACASVLAACWFAASWIDSPPDSTCSAVIYPDSWWHIDRCRTVMTVRAAIAAAMIVIGAALAWIGVRRRHPPQHALVIAWVAFVAVGAITFINELVRSDGGL